jgi:cellulose synthase/poly-beta-1,6-N-acetylglucosamine synthase-like glycosyltransferase
MKEFITTEKHSFYLASTWPNGQKVGALNAVAAAINHEYVILSDFDTDLRYLDRLGSSLQVLDNDPEMIGCYFKMIPYEGQGKVFLFQQLEYSFARMYYKFHDSEQSVPVMPGAGSCFKRELLLKVYSQHSGLRNGEDREATIIGLNLGYKTLYARGVLALTRPPLTFRNLLTQRKRWYCGYIETVHKEWAFYWNMISKGKRIGLRTLQDGIGVLILLLLPLELAILGWAMPRLLAGIALGSYLLSVGYYLSMYAANPDERTEFKPGASRIIALYPLFWLSISFVAWWKAVRGFRTILRKRTQTPATLIRVGKIDVHPECVHAVE